jgi:hypothetical protein
VPCLGLAKCERLHRAPLLGKRRQRPLARNQRLELNGLLKVPSRPSHRGVRDGDRLPRGVEFSSQLRQLRTQPSRFSRGLRRCLPFGEAGTELGLATCAAGDLLAKPSSACLLGVERVEPQEEISDLRPPLGGPRGYPDQALAFGDAPLRRGPLRPQPALTRAELRLPLPHDRIEQ